MPHILVVEDEQHLAFGIKFNLEAEGYEVSVAGDGPTALHVVAGASPASPPPRRGAPSGRRRRSTLWCSTSCSPA
jgi:hypothetical protein